MMSLYTAPEASLAHPVYCDHITNRSVVDGKITNPETGAIKLHGKSCTHRPPPIDLIWRNKTPQRELQGESGLVISGLG